MILFKRNKLIIVDSKTFNDFEYRMYMHDEIMKGIHDIKSGNVMDFDKVMNEISNKYGLWYSNIEYNKRW